MHLVKKTDFRHKKNENYFFGILKYPKKKWTHTITQYGMGPFFLIFKSMRKSY